VRTRILVLDSLYSTQLKMHRYTTDDLIDTLSHTSVGNFKEFITGKWIDDDNAYAELCKLITGEYFGIDITRPITLLSKYFYFLSDFRFPICDSLARTSLSYIYGGRYSMYANQFFKKISELKRGLGTTYQCLDKFLWLYGKLQQKPRKSNIGGRFTTYLNKKEYEQVITDNSIIDLTNKFFDDNSLHNFETILNKLITDFATT